jgi:hypothetical protein
MKIMDIICTNLYDNNFHREFHLPTGALGIPLGQAGSIIENLNY